MAFRSTVSLMAAVSRTKTAVFSFHNLVRAQSIFVTAAMVFQRLSSRRNDIYNILWAVVFGFATLNILNLASRRFEPNRRGMSFGELMAVLIVLLSIFLLGWELLSVFHIFPLRIEH
jgi:hypothetical protein